MHKIPFALKEHLSTVLKIVFGLLFVGLGIYFIKHEKAELSKVTDAILAADPIWVGWGLLLLIAFVVVQGMMYTQSFAAIHQKIRLTTGISLYLKRNLVSVFLPAGMLTNMLFFNEEVEKKEGVSKTQIYFASSIFSFCSILSAILVGLPALLWLLLKNSLSGQMIWGIGITIIILASVAYVILNIVKKGKAYRLLEKLLPGFIETLYELIAQSFDLKKLYLIVGLSVLIEGIGIAHLYIAVKALGASPSIEMAVIGYAIVLLLLMSSPFLRGIGAIEVALTYALTLFGLSTVLSLSIAFLFRFFEFWSVLLLGIIAMVAQKNNLLLRVLPACLIFLLGIVNILSGISPALPDRLKILRRVLPLDAIHASNWMVIFAGILLLAISVYLLRGLRNAWIAAVVLSSLSLLAHFSKGIDWEEATIVLLTLGSLIYQRHQYFIKADLKLAKRSLLPGLIAVIGVLLFGTIGFYFLNPQHFQVNFTLWESFQEAVSTFFLLNVDLSPHTPFGKQFLYGMNILGGITLAYVAFLLLRPLIQRPDSSQEEDLNRAKALVEKYGKGSLDFFKTYSDKKFWFSLDGEGFVSFKTSRNYAVVLENPVCPDDLAMSKIISEFDAYCRQNGLRSAYYRIPEASKLVYEKLGKKLLPIGEEAVVNVSGWTTEGSDKKAIRNAVNKLNKLSYAFQVNDPPQNDAFLQQLRAVSEGWLQDMKRSEIVFSQGLFDETELKSQTILSLENSEGKVVGFVNLIPDYTIGEANFDLMRKTSDAPNGTMDFLFVNMFEYLKKQGCEACNMGMVPMSGIDDPDNLQERVIKLAYERIRQFGHYKSLRSYKEKFNPTWQMMYLVYTAPFDLIYLPGALEQVIEP